MKIYTAKEIEGQIFNVEGTHIRLTNQALTFNKAYSDVYKDRLYNGKNYIDCEVRVENFIKDSRMDRIRRDNVVSLVPSTGIPFHEMTNFQQDVLLNTVAGNESNDGWSAVERQLPIIEEEFNEIKEAIIKRDPTMLRDAIADTLVTTYGMAHRAGFDADEDHLAVTISNFSKFDKTSEDAKKTLKKYEAIGISVKTVMITLRDVINGLPINETYYVAISDKNQKDAKGKSYPEGKFLKSYLYRDPVFNPLHSDNLLVAPVAVEE